MPRPPRCFVERICHLDAHGSDTHDLFLTSHDRSSLLELLALVGVSVKPGPAQLLGQGRVRLF